MVRLMFSSRRIPGPLLAVAIVLLATLSGVFPASPMPTVRACNACNFLLTWGSAGSGNGEFQGPAGVAVDSSGNVYVTDAGNNRVEKFTSTGTYLSQLGCQSGACSGGSLNGQFNGPLGVAVDSSGNVYVTDAGNNRVEKFTGAGVFITTWGSPGSGIGEFNFPYGIAVDGHANVYVTDYGNDRVEKFTSTGTYLSQLGCPTGACPAGSANGQFNSPYAVAVDSSGNVYVTDVGNERIQKFTSTGTFTATWCSGGSGNGQVSGPLGVAVDGSGNVYVVDYGNSRVEKFTNTGTYLSQLGCPSDACASGSGDGQFNFPYGVAVDSSGNVYVTDLNNSRVELFSDTTNFMNIPLVAGWNLISLPLVPEDPAIGKVLAGLIASGNLVIVWSYQGGKWLSFTPPSHGSLTTMQDGFGYWIDVTGPGTLSVFGNVFSPSPAVPPSYPLPSGWNLLGFKPQPTVGNETLDTYLSSITGNYQTVFVYDNLNSTYIRAGGSYMLAPGQAMWLYMTTPATLRP